jgi:hypothetical protein
MDDDGNENGGKKLQPVNGFKAPIEWYETVKRVAAERRTTIGVAIQIVFNLGLPIYEQMKRDENESLKRQYKKLGISSLSQVPHHAEKKKGG